MKKLLLNPILRVLMLAVFTPGIVNAQYQNAQLYVSGNVSSNANMLVTTTGSKTIRGNVVIAEMNGKTTEMRTNENGQAILNFSTIAAGIAVPTVAIIKSFDKDGKLLSTVNTTVQPGIPQTSTGPVMEKLPANLPTNEAVTIKGRNLSADARLFVGNKPQQVLTASDLEVTAVPHTATGQHPVYLSTPGGQTPIQSANFYSMDFNLPKNSISPTESVQAMVKYDGIPPGTVLTFTNRSPQTIKMNIPGASNVGNESIYTVTKEDGRMPVNITGVTRGDFTIALDYKFSNEPANNFNAPGAVFDIANNQTQSLDPCDSIKARIKNIEDRLAELRNELKDLGAKKALFDAGANGNGPKATRAKAKALRAKAEGAKTNSESNKLEKEADELDAKADEMEKNGVTDDKDKNKAEADKLQKEIDDLKKNISELEDALKKAKKKLDDCLKK